MSDHGRLPLTPVTPSLPRLLAAAVGVSVAVPTAYAVRRVLELVARLR